MRKKIGPSAPYVCKHFFTRKVVRPGIGSSLGRLIRNIQERRHSLELTEGVPRSQYECRDRILGRLRRGAEPACMALCRYFRVRSVSGRLDSQNERKYEVARI